jgi:hypothetical protein
VIQEALTSVDVAIDDAIDSIQISDIKFPKDAKKLVTPIIGPEEFLETFNKIVDTGLNPDILGLSVKTINLRTELKKLFDRELSSPDVIGKFSDINQSINELEQKMDLEGFTDTEKLEARIEKIKESLKIPLENVTDKITPEILGFVVAATIPIPLPFPCYQKNEIELLPPYIPVLIAAIKELPAIIETIPDAELAAILSGDLDLSFPLPSVEDFIFFAFQSFSNFVPDLSFPAVESATILKQTILSSIQDFFKFKIRMPRPGVPQIVISGEIIKEAIKTGVKAALAVVVNLILQELLKAIEEDDLVLVLAVAAIIKGIFGVDLPSITGNDIKAFILSSLDSIDDALDVIKQILNTVSAVPTDFKSIKDSLFPTFLQKLNLKVLS